MGYGNEPTAEMPVVGSTPRTEWATLLVDAIDELREILAAKVTPAGIDINATLSMRSGASFYGIEDLAYAKLYAQPTNLAAATYPGALYRSLAGELYYNDAAGNQIALTSSGAVAGTAGSLTGVGYGASGVEVTWVAAAGDYEMRSGAGANDFADIKVDDVLLNDGSGNYLSLAVGSMASDFTLILPAAVPASNNTLMTFSVSGSDVTASFSGTPTVTSLTATGAVSSATLAASGAATVGTTLGVTGATTMAALAATTGAFSSTLTMGSNVNILLQGTGYIRHGSRTLTVPGLSFKSASQASTVVYGDNGGDINPAGVNALHFYGLALPVGTRVTQVDWYAGHSAGGGSRAYRTRKRVIGGAAASIESDSDASTGAVTVSNTTDFTITVDTIYWLEWETNAGAAGDDLYCAVVSYDVP